MATIGTSTYRLEPKLARFVVASSLAALVGVWNLGEQIGQHSLANPDSLQFSLLERYEWLTQQGLIASLLGQPFVTLEQ